MPVDIYSIIAKHSPFAYFVFDINTQRFTYVNDAFYILIDHNGKDLSVAYILSLIPDEELNYLKICFQKLLEDSDIQNLEFKLQVKEEEKWIWLSPYLFISNSEKMILGYAFDITAEKNNIETLKKYANKKNSTLNILAHDLRGPLGIANTITQVLNKKIVDPNLINLIQTVSKILKHSIDMITDLTGREFLETADVELVKKRVNIVMKLKEYIEECQKSENMTKRTFDFESSDDTIFINLDESKFMQVINNLMTNALKFTHDEGIISLTVKEQNHSVLFIFYDNGIGIPQQFHSTLFEKFSDARRKGLHGEPTTGLGLSIVKTIVEWHKGKIWFESKENAGTTFYVEIPKS